MAEHFFHEGGNLRNVKHHVNRFEVQHRGSLHAHIVIWSESCNVDRIAL